MTSVSVILPSGREACTTIAPNAPDKEVRETVADLKRRLRR